MTHKNFPHIDFSASSKNDNAKNPLYPPNKSEPEDQFMRDLSNPEIKKKLDKLFKFFEQHGIDYNMSLPSSTDKKAYPNYDLLMFSHPPANTEKWLQAVKEAYYMEKEGVPRSKAFQRIIYSWNDNEKFSFLNWLRFYEEGAHLKYKMAGTMQIKTAQKWYEGGAPGYFLSIKQDPNKEENSPAPNGRDIDFARERADKDTEKKSIIEKQRSKIIGRLDSAEKLLRSTDGQMFAGKELEVLMEAIYSLKKKIQLVNKISSSVRLYEDMIVREANILNRKGFIKSAGMLRKVADEDGDKGNLPTEIPGDNKLPVEMPKASPLPSSGKDVEVPGKLPLPASPTPPAQFSGAPGGLPSTGPGMPQNPPESAPNDFSPDVVKDVAEKNVSAPGLQGFLSNMSTGKITTEKDKAGAEDDNLEISDMMEIDDDHILVVEAQEIGDTGVEKPVPSPVKKVPGVDAKPMEVSENEKSVNQGKDFEGIIDAAFSGIKITDIIQKLEQVAQIFNNRELPRQLTICDLMLSSIGMSGVFPELAESISKSLDGGTYISTRLSSIIQKLKSATETKGIDLEGNNSPDDPQIQAIKNKLETQDKKEQDRKQKRKEQENIEADQVKETPQIEIQDDLAMPVPKVPSVPAPLKQ